MKRLVAVLLCAAAFGCQSRNSAGRCIGAFDDEPIGVPYKASKRNIVLGAIFWETVVVPVVVVGWQWKCPVEATDEE